MATERPTPAQNVINWADLKRYAAEKERYERDFGAAAPLTNAERAAILTLITPRETALDSAGSGRNWIADLLHYLQVRHHTSELNLTDEPVQTSKAVGKGMDLKWRCFIELPGDEGVFPREGYGAEADEPMPSFARKQDAKQHAAKSACEYLMASSQMSPAGAVSKVAVPLKRPSPTSTPPSETGMTPPSKRQNSQDQGAPLQEARQDTVIPGLPHVAPVIGPNTHRQPQPQAHDKTPSGTVDVPTARPVNELRPAASQVLDLAQSLKLPIPHYECSHDPVNGGTWSVTANFNNHPLPPTGLGAFTGELTKKDAKEKSAEAVLEWMITVREVRERIAREFLGSR